MKRLLTVIVAAFFATTVWGAEARKIDFTAPILDAQGKPAHETDDKSPIATLGLVTAAALYRAPTTDPRMGPQGNTDPIKLAKRALLAQRIANATDAELTAEEIAEIKTAVAVFPPLFVLRVIEAIDPASLK